jgi:hypothetical protein
MKKTTPSIGAMVAKNPKAKESEIRKALRILEGVGGPTAKRNAPAIPYTKPIYPVEPTGDKEPRRVRVSGRR